jgi:hypothetical protein
LAKTERFQNRDVDLQRLATRIEEYLQHNEFEVAVSKDPSGYTGWVFIQARKGGTLRTVAGARRSTDITIKGEPNNFEVTVGSGEWGKNLAASAPLFIVPVVGIGATLTKVYFGKKFESSLWKFIMDQAHFLANTASEERELEYDCDYVEGYPGWPKPSNGGRLQLERQRGDGKNNIIFKAVDGQTIVIPAESVEDVTIATGKKGMRPDDLMIRLESKLNGKTIKPVFNVGDDVARAVLTGINELVGEDKQLRTIEQTKVITSLKHCTNCGFEIAKDAKFCSSCGTKQELEVKV